MQERAARKTEAIKESGAFKFRETATTGDITEFYKIMHGVKKVTKKLFLHHP